MISEKIKAIRELLGLSETQVSNIIFMNSYKYRKSEINAAYLSMEKLLLLSIAYKIPLDKLILEKSFKMSYNIMVRTLFVVQVL